jgi:hypothetical protein
MMPLPPLPANAMERLAGTPRGCAAAAAPRVFVLVVACTSILLRPICAVSPLRALAQLMQIKAPAIALPQDGLR